MRLIDADALVQLLCVNMDTGPQFNRATHCVDVAPAVDAIPIEWLKSKCEEHKNDGFAWVYEAVIDDWRRDHETN